MSLQTELNEILLSSYFSTLKFAFELNFFKVEIWVIAMWSTGYFLSIFLVVVDERIQYKYMDFFFLTPPKNKTNLIASSF